MDALLNDSVSCILALVGTIVVCRVIWASAICLWKYGIRPRTDVWQRYGRPGAWAIVTGASDGIGLAYCKQLRQWGFNLIMVARSQSKLEQKREEIAAEIQKDALAIHTVVIDYDRDYSFAQYQPLMDEIKDKDIAILVNNVGVGHSHYFESYPFAKLLQLIRVNLFSLVFTTRIVLPVLCKRDSRSAVISVSSAVSAKPWPYFTTYGSTKAFMNRAMDCWAVEYCSSNIDFMYSITGEVVSNTHRKGSMASITSECCAKGQLQFLGSELRTCGPLLHYLTLGVDFQFVRATIARLMIPSFQQLWASESSSSS